MLTAVSLEHRAVESARFPGNDRETLRSRPCGRCSERDVNQAAGINNAGPRAVQPRICPADFEKGRLVHESRATAAVPTNICSKVDPKDPHCHRAVKFFCS
jgi:hypothetical protein